MYFVYILESLKNDSLYIGYTDNLKRRFLEHNRRENISTKNGAPWKPIHYEAYVSQEDAERRERYLKTNQGSRLLKRMLREYFYSKMRETRK